jgi:hypothetical protein
MAANSSFQPICCARIISLELHKVIKEVFLCIALTASRVLKIDVEERLHRALLDSSDVESCGTVAKPGLCVQDHRCICHTGFVPVVYESCREIRFRPY